VIAAELHLEREGVLPANMEQLVRRGYLDRIPKDPWGREYYFSTERPDLAGADMPFYVWCLGRDGSAGGKGLDSDVSNWDLFEPPGLGGSSGRGTPNNAMHLPPESYLSRLLQKQQPRQILGCKLAWTVRRQLTNFA
jgi:hypothetical protein